MGWYEERKAGNAIAALKKELALLANVKRDSAWLSLPARELVEGDVIHLKLGDLVPADCELLPNLGIKILCHNGMLQRANSLIPYTIVPQTQQFGGEFVYIVSSLSLSTIL